MQFDPELINAPANELKVGLRAAIRRLRAAQLPLQQALSASSVALDDTLDAMIIHISDQGESVHAKVGIFYQGAVAGCSCADDPTPTDVETEYCELLFTIDKTTGQASVSLAQDSATA